MFLFPGMPGGVELLVIVFIFGLLTAPLALVVVVVVVLSRSGDDEDDEDDEKS